MRKILIAVALLAPALTACTDTEIAHMRAYGGEGHITCYSATNIIYDGDSTGKIRNASQSDGYEFVDRRTNKLTQVSGNCVIIYENY